MRKKRMGGYPLTAEVLNASIDIGAWERHWGGEEEGRRAWAELRDRLRTNVTTRPAPFWSYGPDVPDELRGGGTPDEHRALEAKRLRWLLGPGKAHQRPGEAAKLYEAIGALEG